MVGFFRVRAFFTVAALLGGVASRALAAGPPPAAPLPLTRVRLYETGVGYFERTGPLSGRAVTLPVPAGHLDDALKTLVVLSDDADARIGGVEFSSSVSPSRARALAGLPGEGIPLGLSTLLKSLKGVSVEVSAPGGRVTGTLVEVLEAEQSDLEDCARNDAGAGEKPAPCAPKKQPTLVLLGATGEIRRLRIDDVESVRPLEPAFAPRLAAALDALSDRGARVLKELRVSAQGKKGITLGYVAETPVWRATYRLVLPPDQSKAQIQGWALLHNDTDEAWHRVRVELVNGRPDSFLFPLAAPRYARRTLVTPDEPLSTLPQLAGTTPDALWTGDEYEYGAGGLSLSGVGEGGGGSGEGIGLGSVGTLGHGAGTAGGPTARARSCPSEISRASRRRRASRRARCFASRSASPSSFARTAPCSRPFWASRSRRAALRSSRSPGRAPAAPCGSPTWARRRCRRERLPSSATAAFSVNRCCSA